LSANPPEGGAVSGGGVYTNGSNVTVSAVANADFQFLKWTENGTVVSTNPVFAFVVNVPRNLVAHFVSSHCAITVSANPAECGTVSGGGVYTYGSNVFVSATAHYGFKFVNWTENGVVVAYIPSGGYQFVATGDRDLVANFAPATYGVGIVTNPYQGGSYTGNGVYTHGDQVTVKAFANTGYQFVNWTEYGEVFSTEPEYVFTALGSRSLNANFKQVGKVTVLVNMPGGEVLGGGVYELGDEVTLEAIPAPGYKFVNWSKGREMLSTDNPYRFTVTEDLVIVANFVEDGSVAIDPIDAGAVMIYPNPTSADITVVLNDAALNIVEMELYDLTGKKVHLQTVNQPFATLQMSGLASGVYVLKVFLNQGDPVVWRVVKN